MERYTKPTIEVFAVKNGAILAGSPGVTDETGDGSWHAKDTSWEDDDDLDGGSAIW